MSTVSGASPAPIYSDTKYTTQPVSTQSTQGTGKMGQEQFLNLLITQLKNQDPMDPMKDTEFVSQLASFSSLDKMGTLTQTMQSASAVGMIGKQVTTTKNVQGVVASMSINNGTVYINTDKGDQIAYSDVQQVTNPTTTK
jgi:flagellar basal-body rod modification protein FlgD